MGKRLLLDLEKMHQCRDFKYECSYCHHPDNDGTIRPQAIAVTSLICRRCDEAPCVKACPKEALEKQDDGVLKRYNARCVSCNSCMLACPFGTIISRLLHYLWSRCDFCEGRLKAGEKPLCVTTSQPADIIRYENVEEDPQKHIYIVNDHLAARCLPWRRPEKTKR